MNFSLLRLEAVFLVKDGNGYNFGEPGNHFQQGVQFLCPVCFEKNSGPIGTHSIICWFTNPREGAPVPDDEFPRPGRWQRIGETIETLTLGPGPTGQCSVLLTGGCGAHFHVTNGATH